MRGIKIVATVADPQHWHPGWLRAAEAEHGGGYADWLMAEMAAAVRKTVEAFHAAHPDEFMCPPDVI